MKDPRVTSRRQFLAGAAAAVVATPGFPSWLKGANAGIGTASRPALAVPTTVPLARSTCAPLVGSSFQMRGHGGAKEAVLVGIRDLVPVLRPDDEDRFALRFALPPDGLGGDGIRSFRHDRLGVVDLFITDPGNRSGRFEAVVNRL
jgi:hypothetical protein